MLECTIAELYDGSTHNVFMICSGSGFCWGRYLFSESLLYIEVYGMTRVCKYCGKEFEATGRNASRAVYCSGPHFATCEVCGKKFEIKSFNNGVPRCCSPECSKKLRVLRTRAALNQKYGVEYASQISEVVEKANESRKIVQAVSAEKSKKTCLAKYGVEHVILIHY